MNTRRIIFLSIFGTYQLSVFLFAIFVESKRNDLDFLFKMFEKISWFKWGALIGVIFLVVEFFLSRSDAKKDSDSNTI